MLAAATARSRKGLLSEDLRRFPDCNAQSRAADPTVGAAYLFTTVAAVVVGGTPLTGGRGGYGRTIAGSLVVTELSTLLVGLGLDQAAQQIFLGFLIVALVALYGREPHVSMRV